MTLASKHPSYLEHYDDWIMMRDFYRGERVVKSKTTKYLPATTGMIIDGMGRGTNVTTAGVLQGTPRIGQAAYDAYLQRAVFPDYVKEAVEAYIGMLHQKAPTIQLPKALEPLREKASLYGETLEMLLRRINEEQLVSGRLGLFLDLPADSTKADQMYIATYVAESVPNWDEDEIGEGPALLNFVVLDETGNRRNSEFQWVPHAKYRVLMLYQNVDTDGNPVGERQYQFGVFSADGNGVPTFVQSDMKTAYWRGTALDEIPFQFVNAKDITSEPDGPPLMGLARLCRAIYCGEADLRQNLFMQGQDTLVLAGERKKSANVVVNEDAALRTGAGSVIEMETGGTAQYVGVTANGLSEQRQTLQDDHQRAASRAGQLINTKANGVESGDALKTRVAAQTATLVLVALTSAAALQALLRTAAKWVGANPDEVKVQANLEFADFDLSGDNVVKVMTAIDMGAPLSLESVHALMADQGMTRMDFETEMVLVKKQQEERRKLAEDAAKKAADLAAANKPAGTPGSQDPAGPKDPASKKAGIVPQK